MYNILDEEKRAKVEKYLNLSTKHVDSSEAIFKLGQRLESQCQILARDALHVASAVIGEARYFLSCDKKLLEYVKASS